MGKKEYKFKKKDMDVDLFIGETDDQTYTVAANNYPDHITSDSQFILVEGIADIKFTFRENPTSTDEEVTFAEDVEFEISFPKDAAKKIEKQKKLHPNDPKLKDKTKKDLILAYHHGDAWIAFSDFTDSPSKKDKGKRVKFKKWFADPPVGWGFG